MGTLKPEEVVVQLQIGTRGMGGAFESVKDIAMNFVKQENGIYKYEIEIQPETSGRQDYALRILPFNASVPHPFTPLFVRWEM